MSKASLELGGGNWGTKDGNLLAYAQGNESSNLVPREFTFTRGSDIAATRINSSGLIEKYRENLLLQSNNFSNSTWDNYLGAGFSITGGQLGYDGSNDAWLIEKGATTYRRIQQGVSASGVWTMSVYAKEGTTNIFRFRDNTSNNIVEFDLSTGVATNKGSNTSIDLGMTDVGNGWYRCYWSHSASISTMQIYVGWAESDSVNIYIQDAQLEQGLVATSYLESGATTATSGVADNEPRINYAGGTASLLLEPSRTNLIGYSEYFEGWSNITNITPTSNYTDSPEGVNNATRLQFTANGFTYYISPQVAGVQYTLSCYAKRNDSGTQNVGFFVNGSGTVDSAWSLTNDWKRFTYTYTASNTSQRGIAGLSGADVSVYGFQIEEGSYPTSYIPTYGTSVTRAADGQTLDITNLISSTEGTLFFHLKDAKSHSQTNKILGIGDGSGVDNFFGLYVNDFQTGAVGIRNRQANADLMNTAIPNPQNAKVAIKFSPSGVKTFLNGLEFQSSATAYTGWATSFDLNTTVGDVDLKQYLLFNEALTDREAVNLTSPYSTYQELVTAEGLTWESPTCTTNSITELQSI